MKISLDRISFLEELLFVESLVVKNTSNEKYRFIHVSNKAGKLSLLSANNGLAFAKAIFDTGIDEEFSFSFSPDKLITLLKSLSSEKFNLSIHPSKIIVSSGKSNYTFQTQPFTDIYVQSDGLVSTTDCNYIYFKRAVEIASDFTRTSNTTQWTLTMFEMNLTPTHINTRSTDGNKMAHSSLPDPAVGRDMSINIDRDYVHVLDKLNRAERIQIEKYQNNNVFISGNRNVKIMAKAGALPNTDSVMDKCKVTNLASHTVVKSSLLEPLKRINAILDEKIKKIQMVFGENVIKLIADGNEEEFESTGTLEGKFVLNGQHLMDVIKNSADSLKFNFSQESDFALYITDEQNNQFIIGKTA